MRADSIAGQVLAVISRRTPALRRDQGIPSTFPDWLSRPEVDTRKHAIENEERLIEHHCKPSVRPEPQLKSQSKSSLSLRFQIIAVVFSAAGAVIAGIVVADISQNSAPPLIQVADKPARRTTFPLPVSLRIDPSLSLDSRNFCSWKLGTKPIPLAGINPPKVRIDDRCNYPRDPNPNTDTPTAVYSRAQQNPAYEVTRISDGTKITLKCITSGQNVADAIGNSSKLWIGMQTPDGSSGLIPDVSIGGGYTQRQLDGLGLGQCQVSPAAKP